MSITIVNLKFEVCDVRIDRRTKWGNPFKISSMRSREEAIELYRAYFEKRQNLIDSLYELKDKKLGCWCKPLACHGDVLIEMFNKYCS